MAAADLQVKPFSPENANPPQRRSEGAVGFDFYAEEIIRETPTDIWYRTGYGVDIPDDCFGDLRARSSVSETGLFLANGAGVVDPDYQGEVQFRFYKSDPDLPPAHETEFPDYVMEGQPYIRNVDVYKPGDRIGQLVVVPAATRLFTGTEVVEDFTEETERGEGGFGSTGR
jgi:dUTP pyrophosphatase